MYKEYRYLYETHLHTNQGSACARCSGEEMAKAAKEYGYAGIIVTDHNWGGNTCVDRSLPWEEWVEQFTAGYKSAYAWGREHDLDVFWGYEAGFHGTEFLIYGVSPEWMKAHPQLRTADIPEQYDLVHQTGGMVIHAHPYREEWYIPEIRLLPEYVDGVEGVNATHSNPKSTAHNDPQFDTRAIAYANSHGFPITAGSDIHNTNLFGGGVLFRRRLTSIQDYMDSIRSGDYILTNGVTYYDRFGNILEQHENIR